MIIDDFPRLLEGESKKVIQSESRYVVWVQCLGMVLLLVNMGYAYKLKDEIWKPCKTLENYSKNHGKPSKTMENCLECLAKNIQKPVSMGLCCLRYGTRV